MLKILEPPKNAEVVVTHDVTSTEEAEVVENKRGS